MRRAEFLNVIQEAINPVTFEIAFDDKIGSHPAGVLHGKISGLIAFAFFNADAGPEHALEPIENFFRSDAFIPLAARIDIVGLIKALKIIENFKTAKFIVIAVQFTNLAIFTFTARLVFHSQPFRLIARVITQNCAPLTNSFVKKLMKLITGIALRVGLIRHRYLQELTERLPAITQIIL